MDRFHRFILGILSELGIPFDIETQDGRCCIQKAVQKCVFVSIVFSHQKFIDELSKGKVGEMRGVVRRDDLGDKAFTNLVGFMAKLSMTTLAKGTDELSYNLAPLFTDPTLGPYYKEIVGLKLKECGWPGANDDMWTVRHHPGTPDQFKEAQTLVATWGTTGRSYKPTGDYQQMLRTLLAKFPYRLDTNFAKMDRIAHPQIEAFKKQVLSTVFQGMTVGEWARILTSDNEALIRKSLEDHLQIKEGPAEALLD